MSARLVHPDHSLAHRRRDEQKFDADPHRARPIKREARSPEDLLDQASFFLHRTPAGMPEAHRKILRELHDANEVLHGKKAMIVDDDMRNIFALTSLLEDRGMIVSSP